MYKVLSIQFIFNVCFSALISNFNFVLQIIALFAAIACTSAQVLKLNPLALGTTSAAELQTINLAQTGRLGGVRAWAPQAAWAAPQVAYAAPQIAIAAPQIAYAQAPRIAYAPQIARAAYVNPGLEGPPEVYNY